ncbi:MAG: hypothetical protein ABEI75_03970 [Halobaculum sp.]
MTRGERVRAAARTLREPRSAAWVAEETDVATKTARKYLEQLATDGVLRTVERDGRTLYCVDQLLATYREVARLQRTHDREELTDRAESMRARIDEWQEAYDVDRPGELRATVADCEPEEAERRREVAAEWEHVADRLPVVRAALSEYDWATERDRLPA